MEIFKGSRSRLHIILPNVPVGHKCGRLHGHSFPDEVHVRGPMDPNMGWVIDFADIKAAFKKIKEAIDHRYLNESGEFRKSLPRREPRMGGSGIRHYQLCRSTLESRGRKLALPVACLRRR